MSNNQFTEKLLQEFNKLTAMESSPNHMERIAARLQWHGWVKESNLTKEILNAMKEELIRRGEW